MSDSQSDLQVGQTVVITDPYAHFVTNIGVGKPKTTIVGNVVYSQYEHINITGFPARIAAVSPLNAAGRYLLEFDFPILPYEPPNAPAFYRQYRVNAGEFRTIPQKEYDNMLSNRAFEAEFPQQHFAPES